MTEDEVFTMRMQYAGAIGFLCEVSHRITDPDDRDTLDEIVDDWCNMTGWSWRRVLDRVDIEPGEAAA